MMIDVPQPRQEWGFSLFNRYWDVLLNIFWFISIRSFSSILISWSIWAIKGNSKCTSVFIPESASLSQYGRSAILLLWNSISLPFSLNRLNFPSLFFCCRCDVNLSQTAAKCVRRQFSRVWFIAGLSSPSGINWHGIPKGKRIFQFIEVRRTNTPVTNIMVGFLYSKWMWIALPRSVWPPPLIA